MLFGEVKYRDCPWCMTRNVSLTQEWSKSVQDASGTIRLWAAYSCPRCASGVMTEVATTSKVNVGNAIDARLGVTVVRQVPEEGHREYAIAHLPEDVQNFFDDALVVLRAGVAGAAAVQLRRTLEAAAAHKGVKERSLVHSIEKLISEGAVTVSFSEVLHYVRKLGNLGAHYTDEKLTRDDVERALRFTAQLLRNLFEVPGELEAIKPPDDTTRPTEE